MKRNQLPFVLLAVFSIAALVVQVPRMDLLPGDALSVGDTAWMLTAAALVLLMTPGLSFFYGGMVSFRNVVSTMLQSVIALGVISLIWISVGFGLAFGKDVGGLGIIGNPLSFLFFHGVNGETVALGREGALKLTVPLTVFAMFQLKFAIIAPALITGAFAERVRFSAYLLFIGLFSLLIYCPLAHMTWHPDGVFYQWGVKDFAGGTVVHMSAGWAALAGALVLGRRRAHVEGEAHAPANVPFVMLGTGLLWFGWFGFNAGSALKANEDAAIAFATTNTASASAMLAWIFFDWFVGKKPSALGACIGAVVGLVAITPAAGFVTVAQSVMVGTAASVISNIAVHVRTKSSIDDTLDVFPCHGLGGISGMVFTAIFAKLPDDGSLTRVQLLLAHGKALVIVSVFAFLGALLLFKVTDFVIRMRVSPRDEQVGLDWSQHGETALGADMLGRPTDTREEIEMRELAEASA